MKKGVTIIMLLLLVIACKEKSKNISINKVNDITNNEFLTATIDGVVYSFSDKVKLNSTSEHSHVINGYNKELKTRITLGLNLGEKETGTFGLGNNIVLVYHSNIMFHKKEMYYSWSAKEDITGSSGEIAITKNTDRFLEGTFLFEGIGATKVDRSLKKITEGKFSILKK